MSTTKGTDSEPSIDPELQQLFQRFYDNYPPRYRDDTWYLTMASALTALGAPSHIGPLFTYLTTYHSQPPLLASNRLRSTLMKIFTLTGIAPVLGAFFALVSAERHIGLDTHITTEAEGTISNPSMALDATNYTRGNDFLQLLYQHDLPPIVAQMGRHGAEIMHMEKQIIYGLYLADFSVLGRQETELVAFPALVCGGTRGAGEWHVRGARRVGVEWEEIEGVMGCVKEVANWVLGNEREGGGGSRQEIVPGKGRGEWMRWVEECRRGMEQEESARTGKK